MVYLTATTPKVYKWQLNEISTIISIKLGYSMCSVNIAFIIIYHSVSEMI